MTDVCEDISLAPVEEEAFSLIGLISEIGTSTYVLCCVTYFLLNRQKHTRLRRRSLPMLLLTATGMLIISFIFGGRYFIGANNLDCDLVFALFVSAITLIAQASVTRLWMLYFRVRFNKMLINSTFNGLVDGTMGFDPDTFDLAPVNEGLVNPIQSSVDNEEREITRLFLSVRHKGPNHVKCTSSVAEFLSTFCGKRKVLDKLPKEPRLMYIFTTNRFAMTFFVVVSIIELFLSALIYFLLFEPGEGCTGCVMASFAIVSVPIFTISCLFAAFVVFLVYKVPDSLGVKYEMAFIVIVLILFQAVALPLLSFAFRDLEETGKWRFQALTQLHMIMMAHQSFVHQVWVARKQAKRNKIESSGTMQALFKNKQSLKAFAVYLATELSLENLYFYKSVTLWKSNYEKWSSESIKREALHLFDVFLAENASIPVNVSKKMINAVQEKLHEKNEGAPDVDVFDPPLAEVCHMMCSGPLPRFLKSKFYRALGSEYIPGEVSQYI